MVAQVAIGPEHRQELMTRTSTFLGIGGTLMGSLAQLARQLGHRVSGSDNALYPPMSDQLAAADIEVFEGFDPAQLDPAPDLVVIGNAGLPRGHPGVEYVLEQRLRYTSGAEWLGRRGAARTLGAGGLRHPRQDHHRQHAGLDPGAVPASSPAI
jgi:UDP-N-acetylmuramate-alanine ligase